MQEQKHNGGIMKKSGLLLWVPALFLASCSMMPDWLGDQPAPKLTGERIAVFKLESTLKPDQAMENTPVTLPPVGTAEHLQLSGDLTSLTKISIGDGAGEGYSLGAAPLVAENVIYTLDAKGNVSAYETASGNKQLWRKNIASKKGKLFAGGGLAYVPGKLFITSGSDEIVALNSNDGQELWRKAVGNVMRAAPLALSDGLFVITIDNHLYAIDSRDGHIAWTHAGATESIGVFGSASPVFAAGLLVVPYSSGEIYGLNPSNGQEVWTGNLASTVMGSAATSLNDIDVSPVLSNGVIYAAGNTGTLYAISATTSERLWHQELGTIRGIWAAGAFIYVIGGNNEVICLQAKGGEVKWVAALPRYKNETSKEGRIILSGPVLAGEKLLVAASNGLLFALSPQDGKIIHQTSVPEGIMLPPVVASDHLYLLSNAAKLVIVH